ncbi:hypothetical protein YC2023_040769 [Brassica napus]
MELLTIEAKSTPQITIRLPFSNPIYADHHQQNLKQQWLSLIDLYSLPEASEISQASASPNFRGL